MLRLKDELLKMEFPYVEDGEGQDFGEATWENTVGMIIEHAGQGYTLRRRNQLKVGLNENAAGALVRCPFVRTSSPSRLDKQ